MGLEWLIALVAFALGIGVGLLIFRLFQSDEAKSKKLEDELDSVRHDFEIYKQSVTDHFNETASLVSELTEDYVKVYRHLSEGSQKLVDPAQLHKQLGQRQESALLSAMNESEDAAAAADQAETPVEPPKDYAPPDDTQSPENNVAETENRKSA